jgi:molecular chaperone DnaK (HSP70)
VKRARTRIVGIDLGTTHTVVAWVDPRSPEPARLFEIPQLVSAAEVGVRPLLPSFLYAPGQEEQQSDPFGDAPWTIGEHARQRGREVPGRLVASAKSWLCHPSVDREAAILPWGGEDDAPALKISPVEASARILLHLRTTWDRAFPEHPLAEQTVVLTVPASFDEVARELTVRAAEGAGLAVRLLEEPQAAFYDYVARRGTAELAGLVEPGAPPVLVLVCDVGGGTTDLSLIQVERDTAGAVALSRVAVGRHLLLGGDNIDLALAHLCEPRLVSPPDRLDPRRFAELVHACRGAKEQLLSSGAGDEALIRVLGAGSRLVGSTLATALSRTEVEQVVLEGFLPIVPPDARAMGRRSALVAFGLPYEAEPAISRHVAEFLRRHLPVNQGVRAVLLNGGLFRADRARARLLEVLSALGDGAPVLLRHTDPDLAVAYGAVAYGLALAGRGLKIAGGTAHGYFVAVEGERRAARRAVCVVPRGAGEGERHVARAQPLALRLGEPVRFELYASDREKIHAPGELVELEAGEFERLAPLVASFDADRASGERELRVVLEGELSAVGTVELACVEDTRDIPARRKFRLAFDLRQEPAEQPRPSSASAPPPSLMPGGKRWQSAVEAVERVFGKGRKDVKARESKDLLRELERLLGERGTWNTELNRALFDALGPKHAARRRSADHERMFWLLAGYCLRPGFGHPRDPERVALLAPLFEQGLTFADENRSWQAYFIAFRRFAGGLDEAVQTRIRDLLDPFLAPAEHKLKRPKSFRAQAADELLELASWLERVDPARRAELGNWLLDRTWTSRDPRLWTAIGRIGARIPAYASAHYVVSATTAERWLDHLLREKWDEMPSAAGAAMQLARKTSDRARDVGERVRAEVVRALEKLGAPPEAIESVREVVRVKEAERAAWFEDLPAGLRLIE